MNKPRISVIMSVYKEPVNWLIQSIESILQQTFRDFEFIIICDNPEYYKVIALLKEYAKSDSRIKLIFNESNIGLTKSLNKGLFAAQGEYIARMDGDDISLLERFEKQIKYLDEHHDIAVCGAWINAFGDINRVVRYPQSMSDICMFLESPLAHPVVMFRKAILNDVGYDENYKVSQDYALWARLYIEGAKFYNIPEPLLNYRFNKNQITSKHNILQREMGKCIRRKLINYSLNQSGKSAICKEKLSWNEIIFLKNHFSYLDAKNRSIFIYYIYLSSPVSVSERIFHLFFDFDIFRMSFLNSIRVIYYALRKKDISKF